MSLHVVVIGSVGFGLRICSLVDCLCSGCLIGFLVNDVAVCYFGFMGVGYLLLGWLGPVF